MLIGAQLAYWCNATFAFTMAQGATTDIRAAFREADPTGAWSAAWRS